MITESESQTIFERCNSCGLVTPISEIGVTHRYLQSSAGCWEKYGELLAREYENYEYMTVHSLTVDAYALQHTGEENAQNKNSIYVHLASLYCYFDLGMELSMLPKRKQEITKFKSNFEWLQCPANLSDITVADILEVKSSDQHKARVNEWAAYVYNEWKIYIPEIKKIMLLVDSQK